MKKCFVISVAILCLFSMSGCFFNSDDGKSCSYDPFDEWVELPGFQDYCFDSSRPTSCIDGYVETTECLSREVCGIDEFGYAGCFLNVGHECEFTQCHDDWNLDVCTDGWVRQESCYYGCIWESGECGGPVCDHDECDGNLLYVCDDGLWADKPTECQFGCSDRRCNEAECTQTVCGENNKLLECQDGHIIPKDCEFGCDKGKCNPPECTQTVCGENNELLECIEGYVVSSSCSYGCDKGKCKMAECTESVCSDDNQSLIACVDGMKDEVYCYYKCDNKQCVVDETARCLNNKELLIRNASDEYRIVECEHSCMNGTCMNETQSVCIDENTEAWGAEYDYFELSCKDGCVDDVCSSIDCSLFKPVCMSDNVLLTCENGDIAYKFGEADEVCYNGEILKKVDSESVCKSEKVLSMVVSGASIEMDCAGQCLNNACVGAGTACKALSPESEVCQGFEIHQCSADFSIEKECSVLKGEVCIETVDSENVEIIHADCKYPCDPVAYKQDLRIVFDSENFVWNYVSTTCIKDRRDIGYIQSDVLKTSKYGFNSDGSTILDETLIGTECDPETFDAKCLENGFAIRCGTDEITQVSTVEVEDCRRQMMKCATKDKTAVCEE